jgi:hypothetical protein
VKEKAYKTGKTHSGFSTIRSGSTYEGNRSQSENQHHVFPHRFSTEMKLSLCLSKEVLSCFEQPERDFIFSYIDGRNDFRILSLQSASKLKERVPWCIRCSEA